MGKRKSSSKPQGPKKVGNPNGITKPRSTTSRPSSLGPKSAFFKAIHGAKPSSKSACKTVSDSTSKPVSKIVGKDFTKANPKLQIPALLPEYTAKYHPGFDFSIGAQEAIVHQKRPACTRPFNQQHQIHALKSIADRRQREVLATTFKCVFCNSENSVTVKIDKKAGTGDLSCKQCHQQYQMRTTSLDQPIDVYSEWIDACDAVANEAAPAVAPSRIGGRMGQKKIDEDVMTAEDEGFVVDDEVDAEAEYADEE